MKKLLVIIVFLFSSSVVGQINSFGFDCNFTASNETQMHNNGIVLKKIHNDNNYSYRLSILPESDGFSIFYPSNGNKDKGVELTQYNTLSKISTNRTFLFDTTFISIYSSNPFDDIKPKPNTYTAILSQHLSGIGGPRAFQEYGYCVSK